MNFDNLTNDHNKNSILKYLFELIAQESVDLYDVTLKQEFKEIEIGSAIIEQYLGPDFTIVIRGRNRRWN